METMMVGIVGFMMSMMVVTLYLSQVVSRRVKAKVAKAQINLNKNSR